MIINILKIYTNDYYIPNSELLSVKNIKYSIDGKYIIAIFEKNYDFLKKSIGPIINIWDAITYRKIKTINLIEGKKFIISNNSKYLAIEDGLLNIRIIDMLSGNVYKNIIYRNIYYDYGFLISIKFSSDDKTLILNCNDEIFELIDIDTGLIKKTIRFNKIDNYNFTYFDFNISSDNKYISYFSGSENIIKILNTGNNKTLTLRGHDKSVIKTLFSSDNKKLISLSADNTIKVWDINNGELLKTISIKNSYILQDIIYSRDNKMIASCSWNGQINIWNAESFELTKTLYTDKTYLRDNNYIESISFSPDCNHIASGNENGEINVWDINENKLIFTIKNIINPVISSTTSYDGKLLASIYYNDSNIKLWDTESFKLVKTLDGHSNEIFSIIFSNDDNTIATSNKEGIIRIIDIISGEIIQTFYNHIEYDTSFCYSFDSKKIITSDESGKISVMDIKSGKIDKEFIGQKQYSKSIKLFNNEVLVSLSKDNSLIVWNYITGKIISSLKNYNCTIYDICFSSSGQEIFLSTSDNLIKIWDFVTGKIKTYIKTENGCILLKISPDNKTIAFNDKNNSINIIDLNLQKIFNKFEGHSDAITSINYINNNMLITSSKDCSIKYWDLIENKNIITSYFFNTNDYISILPSYYYISSVDGDKNIYLNNFNILEQYSEIYKKNDLININNYKQYLYQNKIENVPSIKWINKFDLTDDRNVQIIFKYEGSAPINKIVAYNNDDSVTINKDNIQNNYINLKLNLTKKENIIKVQVTDNNHLKSKWLKENFIYSKGIELSDIDKYLNNSKGGTSYKIIEKQKSLGEYNNKYAIVIGISKYKNLNSNSNNKIKNLKYADKDAKNFSDFLKDDKYSGGNWNIKLLVNENATINNIDMTISETLNKANENDLIFIFFSGHARQHPINNDEIYLLSYDFNLDDYTSGFNYSTLLKRISRCKCKHIISFIDSCHSGGLGLSKGEKSNYYDELMEQIKNMKENKVFITSCKGNQQSFEDDDFKMGVFTYFLIKGLKGAAKNTKNSQYVMIGDLYEYVRENVKQYTEKKEKEGKMEMQIPECIEANGLLLDTIPVSLRE
jgi:WD40 repeat protein